MIFYSFSILVLVINYSFANLNLPEGSPCTTTSQGAGICTTVENCPSAKKLIENEEKPLHCSFDNIKPIVCCPETEPPLTTSIPIHARKCEEYGTKVYERVRKPGLTRQYYNRSVCAVTSKTLVFGGENAKPKEFPHMALLGYQGDNNIEWDCGGSLISEKFVLTAAHCLYHQFYGSCMFVRLGVLDKVKADKKVKPQDIKVKDTIYHPEYKSPSQYHDIGLVQLEQDAIINAFVRPICLYDRSTTPDKFLATGWGATENDDSSDILQKVTLQIYPHDTCVLSFRSKLFEKKLSNGITDNTQLCAGGGQNEEKDTCQGDSGGPLQIYHDTVYCMYSIVGVTSAGTECGVHNTPGIYTRVSAYIPWIELIVWGSE